MSDLLRNAGLVARKDLLIEWRSKVAATQIMPFALLVLVLFGLAMSGDSIALRKAAPGLFWVTVLLAALLAVQRASAVETADGALAHLRLAGLEPAAIFLGKGAAVAVQLVALEAVLAVGILVLYDVEVESIPLFAATAVVAALGTAAAGTLYGALAAGLQVRETILPILLLPVLAPVLIGATRATGDALGVVAVTGWSWLGLLGIFTVSYLVVGTLTYGVLLEDS